MNYKLQLQTEEWKEKRQLILNRDNHCCQECHNNEYSNHFMGEMAFFCEEFKDMNSYELDNDSNSFVYINKYKTNKKPKIFVYYEDINNESNNNIINYIAIRRFKIFDRIDLEYKDEINEIKQVKKTYDSLCKKMNEKDAKLLLTNLYKIDVNVFSNYVRDGSKPLKKDFKRTLSLNDWLDVKHLHIHHKYYQNELLAWEYPNYALITLCWFCHKKLHENSEIEILDKEGNIILGKRKVCSRCFGAGYLPEFSYVQNGICFKCNGDKK